jgi:hypothetical protein
MSKRVLRGNDISVSWRVKIWDEEGHPISLNSLSFGVQLIVGENTREVTSADNNLTIAGDLITFIFYGRQQTQTGPYILKLYNANDTTITYYACNAFVIVNREGEEVETQPTSIEVESSTSINRTIWAKGEKGDKGDKGDNGAAGTIGSILTIGDNGNWWIDGVDTGIPATGPEGTAGAFKSIVFKRSLTTPSTPVGGTYADPVPHDPDTNERWSDGIPTGEGLIWASSSTFFANDQHTAWTAPQLMKDTAELDIEFAKMQNNDEKPAYPAANNRHKEESPYGYNDQVWFDPVLDEFSAQGVARDFTKMYWMAQRQKSGTGETDWTIFRIQGEKGDPGQARFKSTIFVRLNKNESHPEWPIKPGDNDGSFNSPAPATLAGKNTDNENVYWSDGIPAGNNTLWASTRTFTIDGQAPQDASWSTPRIMTDTENWDVEFAYTQEDDADPPFPNDNNRHKTASPYGYTGQVWFDPSLDMYDAQGHERDFKGMCWRAEREIINGEPQAWIVIRIKGEKGEQGDGMSSFKSTMFVRMNDAPTRPAANMGSFADPSPSGCQAGRNSAGSVVYWSDGIPEGSNILWATTRIFTSSGESPQQESWTEPRKMTDTAGYDVEFALQQDPDEVPVAPDTNNRHKNDYEYGYSGQVWFDPDKDKYSASGVLRDFTKMFWRAEQKTENGVKKDWVITRIQGERGEKGERSSVAYLYKRSETKPTRPGADTETNWPAAVYINYTFATGAMVAKNGNGEIVSIPAGWTTFGNIPDGTATIWAIAATAVADSDDPDDALFKNQWSDPTELGAGGKDGINCLNISLYKRSVSNPGAFTRDTVFDFEHNTLTFEQYSLKPFVQSPDVTIDGWRRYIPDGTDPLWSTSATALSAAGANDTIEEEEWSPPAKVGGENGANGIKSTVVFLYRRSTSELTSADKPNQTSTYSFEEKSLLSDIGEWKRSIPNGGDPIWIVAATAACPADQNTDDISANEWSDPARWANETINSFSVTLYQRSSSTPSKPNTTLYYHFSTGNITVGSASGTSYAPNSSGAFAGGWRRTIPSGSDQCYVVQATALSFTDVDDIPTSEWSDPAGYVKDGQPGEKGDDGESLYDIVTWYKVSSASSGITPPATTANPALSTNGGWTNGNTSTIPSTDATNKYLWCFTRWRYSYDMVNISRIEQSNAYIARQRNDEVEIPYDDIEDMIQDQLEDELGANGTTGGRIAALEGTVNTINTTYVTQQNLTDARTTWTNDAITSSVTKGELVWKTEFTAFKIKGFSGANVTGTETISPGDTVIVYGQILSNSGGTYPRTYQGGSIYRWNNASSWNGSSAPAISPSSSYSGSGTYSSPYNVRAAVRAARSQGTSASSGSYYIKGVVAAVPEIVPDSTTPANGYITLVLSDYAPGHLDVYNFKYTSGDYSTYETTVKGLGYTLSTRIDEMSAIRQESDNIFMAVGDGKGDVAAAIKLVGGLETSGGKIILDANTVEVNGQLSANIINSQSATIENIAAGSINTDNLTAKKINTGTTSNQLNVQIEGGMLEIKNGSTKRAAFGLNSNGEAILSFYDSSGNEIYNLGPSGFNHV